MGKLEKVSTWAALIAAAVGAWITGCDDLRNSETERAANQIGAENGGSDDAGFSDDGGDGEIPWRCDWEPQAVPMRNDPLVGALGFAPDDLYAIGMYGLYRFGGESRGFEEQEGVYGGDGMELTAIAGSSDQDLFVALAVEYLSPEGVQVQGELHHLNASGWWAIDYDIMERPNALALANDTDLFLVGGGGMIKRCNRALTESACAAMSSPTDQALRGVAAQGAFAYAVGDEGTILRYNGSSWVAMWSPTTKALRAVAAASDGAVYAVGDEGTVLRYSGGSWAAMSSPTAKALRAVATAPDGAVYAVGDEGTVLALDGGVWSQRSIDTAMPLLAVAAFDGDRMTAVGGEMGRVSCDGSACTVTTTTTDKTLADVDGPAPDDLYGVGPFGTIVHYDGSRWQAMQSPTHRNIKRVRAVAPDLVYAIQDPGVVLRYDGVSWQPLPALPPDRIEGFYAAPNGSLFATSIDTSAILFFDGTSWQEYSVELLQGGGAMVGRSDKEVYTADDFGIWRFDGQSWNLETDLSGQEAIPCDTDDCYPWIFNLALLGDGGLVAVGTVLTGGLWGPVGLGGFSPMFSLHVDSGRTRLVITETPLFLVDGIAPDAVMAVGSVPGSATDENGGSPETYELWRFDGERWQPVDPPSGADPDSAPEGVAPGFIHMADDGQVFVSQTGSRVLHGTNCAPSR